jgi:small subunit ribosomal protein S17
MNVETSKKNILIGQVVSDKMDKTVVVKVQRTFTHPRFKKIVRSIKKYKVHDEKELAKVGDVIEIFEGKPMSKTKYMYLHRVVKAVTAGI